jgi:cathepsin L
LVLSYADEYLEKDANATVVETFLEDTVCKLVSPLAALCDLLVKSYTPRVIIYMESELTPDQFCNQTLHLCNSSSLALTEAEYRTHFVNWMQEHSKTYHNDEFMSRYSIFKNNLDFVRGHDAEAKGFSVALNEFADLTNEEFVAIYNGLAPAAFSVPQTVEEVSTVDLPTTVDWRQKGAVTGIKNQGQCGSCWSFSTTGSTEGARVLQGGKSLVGLSEQNLMDCSTRFGNMGCNGGLMDDAFKYIMSNNGLDTEASYPYTAEDGTCHYSSANCGATITGYQDIPSGSESSLQTSSANIGPISVAIDASHSSFQFYSGGVYYEPACSSSQLDHGVLVVGYGTDNGSDYWLVKNSWGTSWGLQGYIQMSRNRNNNCGIATAASYPTGGNSC